MNGEWGKTSVEDRAIMLEKIAATMEKHHKDIALTESLDTGKPINLAYNFDVNRSISNFRFFASCVRNFSDNFHQMQSAINYT